MKLSQTLATLVSPLPSSNPEGGPSRNITVRELVNLLGTDAFVLLLIFFSIPCALPLPGTGISTPFGFAVLVISLQMISPRESLWLPEWILNRSLSPKILLFILKCVRWVEAVAHQFFRPRFLWVQSRGAVVVLAILISLLALLIQVPIPVANVPPAIVILGLSLSLLEHDGILATFFVALGLLTTAAYLALFVSLAVFGTRVLDQMF